MSKFFLYNVLICMGFFSGCQSVDQKLTLHDKPPVQQSVVPHFDAKALTFDEQTFSVVILGGGVAGLTAANYCVQAGIPCLVVEGEKPGGALAQSDSVRNWPGILNLPGADIVNMMKKQVLENGVTILHEKVIALRGKQWPYVFELQHIETGNRRTIKALSSILAMGTEPNYLNVPGERGEGGYWGRGVTNCAICDGSLYRGKNVVVVGAGDSAILEASYLSGIASQVTMLVRKDVFRAKDKRKKDEVLARPNVKVLFNSEIKEVLGDGNQVTHIRIRDTKSTEEKLIAIDGVFLAIGAHPNTAWLKGQLELDASGYVVLCKGQSTSVPGIFAAGDICDPEYKQAITSASDGCKSALQVQKFLDDCRYDAKTMSKQRAQPLISSVEKQVSTEKQISEPVEQTPKNGVLEISSTEHFEKIIAQNKRPIIADIYANLCLACKQMEPIVYDLARLFEEEILFLKINLSNKAIDPVKMMSVISGKKINSAPTFLLINKGHEVDRFEGMVTMAVFEQKIMAAFSL